MYIESMLMRGEDLYNYKYRQKLDKETLESLKQGNKELESFSYQYLHKFLEQ